MEEFPSNSHRSKEPKSSAPKVKKVEKVIESQVIRQKKTLGQQLVEKFIGDSIDNVLQNLTTEVLIPAAKEMFLDGMERMLNVENGRRRRGSRSSGGNGHFSYNTIYTSKGRYAKDESPRNMSSRHREMHDFDPIIFRKRHEALTVLEELEMIIIDHGETTVGDLYRLVDEEADFTDEKWGWKNLDHARVERKRHGYLLRLPRPEPVD